MAKFDLTLSLVEHRGPGGEPQGIEGGLICSLDLFERQTAEALAARLVRLLEQCVQSPDLPLHRLEILSRSERQTVLEGFNATAHPVPAATLPELFEAQAARTPDAVAVVCGDESLSYGELNARANRLAHHLIGLGVGPEILVGICLERSTELVVALLACTQGRRCLPAAGPKLPRSAAGADAG